MATTREAPVPDIWHGFVTDIRHGFCHARRGEGKSAADVGHSRAGAAWIAASREKRSQRLPLWMSATAATLAARAAQRMPLLPHKPVA
jgi:hypothetical protein